jgi:phosphoglycerol transferase MdoB-like AlkP superfamily enzyme
MLLLVFPLWKLRPLIRFSAVALLGLLVLADFYAGSAGLVGRVASIASLGTGTGIASIIFDASLNLRVGHIYFTMFLNLIPELELRSPVGFMAQYNAFAAQSGIFMDTGSDYILPAIGEMIYGAGVVALALLFVFVRRALARCSTRRAKFQRFVFIMACMINPISLSNIFLVLYAQSEE